MLTGSDCYDAEPTGNSAVVYVGNDYRVMTDVEVDKVNDSIMSLKAARRIADTDEQLSLRIRSNIEQHLPFSPFTDTVIWCEYTFALGGQKSVFGTLKGERHFSVESEKRHFNGRQYLHVRFGGIIVRLDQPTDSLVLHDCYFDVHL